MARFSLNCKFHKTQVIEKRYRQQQCLKMYSYSFTNTRNLSFDKKSWTTFSKRRLKLECSAFNVSSLSGMRNGWHGSASMKSRPPGFKARADQTKIGSMTLRPSEPPSNALRSSYLETEQEHLILFYSGYTWVPFLIIWGLPFLWLQCWLSYERI